MVGRPPAVFTAAVPPPHPATPSVTARTDTT
jgi:hypothetical protein